MLTWSELEDVLLDVEINLRIWLLTYIEGDLDYSVLTPDSMTLGRDIKVLYGSLEEKEVSDNWEKRQRYLHKCKEAAWKWWVHEYLAALRKKHNLSHTEKLVKININDEVMIKEDDKNCKKWKIRIIENDFMVKDNTFRSNRIRTGKSVIERPVELLYRMELHCD